MSDAKREPFEARSYFEGLRIVEADLAKANLGEQLQVRHLVSQLNHLREKMQAHEKRALANSPQERVALAQVYEISAAEHRRMFEKVKPYVVAETMTSELELNPRK